MTDDDPDSGPDPVMDHDIFGAAARALSAAQARAAKLEKRVGELEAALKPFADADETFIRTPADKRIWIGHYVTRDDFRRAAAAIKEE